ncbi:MAG: acetylglutamate kinase [Clostridia bacterium]|nr:acetylglutamate kinase [Clostridia bacterium]
MIPKELFKDKIYVIKFGGSIMHTDHEKACFIDNVLFMKDLGVKIVIVHGGGQFITKRLDAMQIPTEFKEGYRVTTKEAMKEVEMLLGGSINKDLTMNFNQQGLKAVGLTGKDGACIKAKKKLIKKGDQFLDIGNVGEIEAVDTHYIDLLLSNEYIPVVAPIGYDAEGTTYNLNADDVAGKLCGALKAEKLILMTDVDGLYKEFSDASSFIPELTQQEAKAMIDSGIITDGMIPKLNSCITSLEEGAKSAHIINGMTKNSLLYELFSVKDFGTTVTQ